ncbi:hypothetical protein FO519_004213 [Halicephalobus sp. NKZ332]|nr:hypothetical protein FO519_004213 [Halicephalobus sp. NKZ332]
MSNHNSAPGQPLDIRNWRKDYHNMKEPFLHVEHMDSDPFIQFDLWFKDISLRKDITFEEINAVALSTCRNNKPSCRMVLLKKYDEKGFSFYTNYSSRKGQEIEENPNACMCFYWPFVTRQVRIEGVIEKLPLEMADEYWKERPLHSRIGSKASHQSTVIESRAVLEDEKHRLEELAAEKGEEAITRPPEWAGFTLKPSYFEFWQGQSNRLHDRIIYEEVDGHWTKKRLSP